jgi:hypothetical protein
LLAGGDNENSTDALQYADYDGGWGTTSGGSDKRAFGGSAGRFNEKTDTGWDGHQSGQKGGGDARKLVGFGGGSSRLNSHDVHHHHVGDSHGHLDTEGKGLKFGELREGIFRRRIHPHTRSHTPSYYPPPSLSRARALSRVRALSLSQMGRRSRQQTKR